MVAKDGGAPDGTTYLLLAAAQEIGGTGLTGGGGLG